MKRRVYKQKVRAEQLDQKRERIVRATVALHAKHGPLATSYPMIAARARVSTQTVYNHFPDLGQLVGACTGHVFARAPSVSPDRFSAGKSPEERLRLLVDAVHEQQAFTAPWMRFGWSEARAIPALATILSQAAAGLKELIALALKPERVASPEFIDVALALLDYPGWKQLSRGRSNAAAAKLAGECLTALLPALTDTSKQEDS
jgi:AcrR family transcriptional regulator